jgi:hypothetical protein
MSDNDLIRRGDAIRQADRWVRGFVEADTIGKAIAALPAADPLADPRVQALVEAADKARIILAEYEPHPLPVLGELLAALAALAEIEGEKG